MMNSPLVLRRLALAVCVVACATALCAVASSRQSIDSEKALVQEPPVGTHDAVAHQQHDAGASSSITQTDQQSASSSQFKFETKFGKFKLPSFETYQKLFRKSYKSLREKIFRCRQFIASSLRAATSLLAFRSHKPEAPTYYLGINQFSDLTPEEKRARVGVPAPYAKSNTQVGNRAPRIKRDLMSMFSKRKSLKNEQNDDSTIDWRRREPSGCLPEPGPDQGECGCCYAMATLKLLEWDHCRQSGAHKPIRFSPQYIVDCGRPFGLSGCEEGNPLGTFEFIRAAGLLETWRMPFKAEEAECPAGPEMVPVSAQIPSGGDTTKLVEARRHSQALVPAQVNYQVVRDQDKWLEELRHGPLVVYVNLSEDFYDYGGGVYEAPERGGCDPELGHFMLLVGRGLDSRTRRPYWLLSNSFGELFGESGYVRLLAESRKPRTRSSYDTNCLLFAVKGGAQF